MRVAIIGGGSIAEVHAPLILDQPNAELVGIADLDMQRAQSFSKEFDVKQAFQDPRAMIEDLQPDVVHVLVPPQLHAEISIMAMDLGSHVLVEKPVAPTVAEAERMIATANKNTVSLCVDHNGLRYGVYRKAIELAKSGNIGQVVSVEAHEVYNAARNPAFIEEGAENRHWAYQLRGGPLADMMPHPAACILQFMDDIKEVKSVSFSRGTFPGEWQDEIRVLVRSDDVVGYINVSVSERPDIESLTIRGTKGLVYADAYNDIVTVRRLSNMPRKISRGLSGFQLAGQYMIGAVANVLKVATGKMEKANGIGVVISEFYESIQNGSEPPVSLDTSLRVVKLMNQVWPE
jgi:predicted dehydrogenase